MQANNILNYAGWVSNFNKKINLDARFIMILKENFNRLTRLKKIISDVRSDRQKLKRSLETLQ